jgi:hypothetical protein
VLAAMMTAGDVTRLINMAGQVCTITRAPVVGQDAYNEDILGDPVALYTDLPCYAFQDRAIFTGNRPEAVLAVDQWTVYLAGNPDLEPATDVISGVTIAQSGASVVGALTIQTTQRPAPVLTVLVCRQGG